MSDDLYALLRYQITPNVSVGTIYNDNETKYFGKTQLIEMVTGSTNVEYLTKMIIEQADPLRNNSSLHNRDKIKTRVIQLLESWTNMGKFDGESIQFEGKKYLIKTVSPVNLLDHYNKEFISTFTESILSTNDVTKVTSVTNPNGLYAQQERIITINSKPIPFYQRAVFRRLNDWTNEQQLDETEMPFYKMDHNPRLTATERKKTELSTRQDTYLDREGLSYRMKPQTY